MLTNPRLLWAVILVLLTVCLGLACFCMDRSISLSYMSASSRASEEARDQAIRLLASEWKNITHEEVFTKLTAIKSQPGNQDLVLKEERAESQIWFGHLLFRFMNNRLAEIS